MILITGAGGSVGRALQRGLEDSYLATDITPGWYPLDVTDARSVAATILDPAVHPSVIYHLAGAKHAFDGELDPGHAARVNIQGTANILTAAARLKPWPAKVVFSSTCKACDPETAYGASKLIAERLVLNAGGVVVRYYNIPESDGNVFRSWEQIPLTDPIPYTDCWRYFLPMASAVRLTIAGSLLPSGRYTEDPGLAKHMRTVAEARYPGRALVEVPRRRGDRHREPLVADCEDLWPVNSSGLYQIHGPYDTTTPAVYAAAEVA